ncbi:MAG: ATP-binding cassette domain-containing protein, partial [Promethearchaeota archaeon]
MINCSGLRKWFPVSTGFISQMRGKEVWLKAIDDVNLSIYPDDMYCVAGESGCGKTTLGKLLIGLHDPTDGTVTVDGH